MKKLKEYALPQDRPECPRALRFYDEKLLVEDWMKEHPEDTISMCIGGLMRFSHGRLNPGTLKKHLLDILKG